MGVLLAVCGRAAHRTQAAVLPLAWQGCHLIWEVQGHQDPTPSGEDQCPSLQVL